MLNIGSGWAGAEAAAHLFRKGCAVTEGLLGGDGAGGLEEGPGNGAEYLGH